MQVNQFYNIWSQYLHYVIGCFSGPSTSDTSDLLMMQNGQTGDRPLKAGGESHHLPLHNLVTFLNNS